MVMKFLAQLWEALLEWSEEINEYRRKNHIHRMY